VGGVATKINAVNYVSPRNWLSTSHFILGFLFFVAICGMQEEPGLLLQVLKRESNVIWNMFFT
jgi:hypothetical protein